MSTPLKHSNSLGLDSQLQPQSSALDLEVTPTESPIQDDRDAAEILARKAIEEFMKLPPKEREAKIAAVYERGILNDRLKVELPDDLYGEWESTDPLAIKRKEALGFWIDNNYANKRAIHSDGSSASKIGDVVHMVTMRANKEMIDKVMQDQQRRNADPRAKRKEDTEFESNVARDTGGIIPAFSEGQERTISMDDVREAIRQANSQTVPQR